MCAGMYFYSESEGPVFFVMYSEEGCSKHPAELQAWVHFCDFLYSCGGVSLSQSFILPVFYMSLFSL